jgi:hypothetical protein
VTVAALYVETGGAYFALPGVEPYDQARDARTYSGPWPVVAHPPCNRWSTMGLCRPGHVRYGGSDGGCFEAALEAVRAFGGVLEHPRYTYAWERFALPEPPTEGWAQSFLDPGWSCELDQWHYGHAFRKPTWLYYVGPPPPMAWGLAPRGTKGTHNAHHWGGGTRSTSPPAFRDALLALARLAATPGATRPR